MKFKQFLQRIRVGRRSVYRYDQQMVKFSPLLFVFVFLSLLILTSSQNFINTQTASAASLGPRTATASSDCVNDASAGDASWSLPTRAQSDDNASSYVFSLDGTSSNYLVCTNFGFNVPVGSTINGIIVSVERWADSTGNGGSSDAAMRIVKGGVIGTTDRSTTTTYTTTPVLEDHGGSSDLWGETWTVSDINASNFGAAFRAQKANTAGPSHRVDVDVITITIDYTPPAFTQTHYRWRDDTTALNTNGGWLNNTAEDTIPSSTYTRVGEVLRLRIAIDNASAQTISQGYSLQWSVKGASCSASSGWTRIDTGSDAWEMVSSAQYVDGDSITSGLLTSGGATFTNGFGLESPGDDTAPSISMTSTQYSEIEWAIRATSNAIKGSSYCFRVVTDGGAPLSTYTNYPEVALFLSTTSEITQEAYIWENDDGVNADSNSQQVIANTAINSVKKGERLNLRTQIKNTGDEAETDNLALFYDRGDGLWSKVQNNKPITEPAAGEGCDEYATGSNGDAKWKCYVIDDQTDLVGENTSLAFSPDGTPYISYINTTQGSLILAQFVGSGGNCDTYATGSTGSDAWQCTIVDDQTSNLIGSSLAFSPDGVPYIAYRGDGASLTVAQFVGSGGNCDTYTTGSAGSDAWQCTIVDEQTGTIQNFISLAFDNNGTPYVSYNVVQGLNPGRLVVASFVGSGGNCDTYATLSTGSDAWQCTIVDNQNNSVGLVSSIAVSPNGSPYVSYIGFNGSLADKLHIASFVGSGGNCDTYAAGSTGSDAWQCTIVDDQNDTVGLDSSISFSPDGTPFISYSNSTADSLHIASFVGSGGNCDTYAAGSTGSDAWQCTIVDNQTDEVSQQYTSLAFSPDGTPFVGYSNTTDGSLLLASFVGSGGNCDTYAAGSTGSDAWQCTIIDDQTDIIGDFGSIAFSPSGGLYISYKGSTNSSVNIANISIQSEITLSPSLSTTNGASLAESHTDMTTTSDTTNRDDADCITASAWNNGVHSIREELTGINLQAGDITSKCTEVSWTIDTSQAVEGTTYRFVVASKDNWRPDKGVWRGPVQIDEYPTLTIEPDTDIRYSKANNPTFQECTNEPGWGCVLIDNHVNAGGKQDISYDSDGNAHIVYSTSANNELNYAKYVGSGGSGCVSSAWDCSVIRTVISNTYMEPEIEINKFDEIYTVFFDASSKELFIAKYVGSGGSGCASSTWNCEVIDVTVGNSRMHDVKFMPNGDPVVAYEQDGVGEDSIGIAQYTPNVGANCTSSNWTCTSIDSATGGNSATEPTIGVSSEGKITIAYRNYGALDLKIAEQNFDGSGTGCLLTTEWTCSEIYTTGTAGVHSEIVYDVDGKAYIGHNQATDKQIIISEYVGSGGSGCSLSSWNCYVVDDGVATQFGRMARTIIGPDNIPYILYVDDDNSNLKLARYVGSGGSGCTSTLWSCENLNLDGNEGLLYEHAISFSSNGELSITYYDSITGGLRLAKKQYSSYPLSANIISPLNATDLLYRINDGRSPRTNDQGICGGAYATLNGYCGIFDNQGDYDSIVANPNESPIYAGAVQFDTNTELPEITWEGRTDVAPNTAGTAGDIVLQVYRFGTTNAWETIATDSTSSDCNTVDCTLSGSATGTISDYFQTEGTEYWVNFRVYQVAHTTGITFKVDKFSAQITDQKLRGGRLFENGVRKPLLTE